MRLKPWPILAGVLVDAVGSLLLGAGYAFAIIWPEIGEVTTPTEDPLTTPHLVTIAILGLLSTAAGGYVAGRLATLRPVAHGIAVGAFSLVLWLIVEWVDPTAPSSEWYDIASLIAVLPAGALGGYLAGTRISAQRPQTT